MKRTKEGWQFPDASHMSDRIESEASDLRDIQENLRILISTEPGEGLMHPSYGVAAPPTDLSFEDWCQVLRQRIETAVRRFEPRIILDQVETSQSGSQELIVNVCLAFIVVETGDRGRMDMQVSYKEGTAIKRGDGLRD